MGDPDCILYVYNPWAWGARRIGEAAGPLGGGERDSDHAGARVLRTAEHGIECREVRSASGSDLPEVLQEQFGPSVDHARNVLPDAAVGLLRGHRFGARHQLAGG